eukprot:TRINITY_DN5073_c0_g2_i1.p1 TRINITY_DN5073_c0_g2~~TRINITY_DN5073_c0_g2_i1.p1  ORF type:complete len:503 (+),score=104.61 TRINITY_DN5073_c0_g2_i1:218-1726(+)
MTNLRVTLLAFVAVTMFASCFSQTITPITPGGASITVTIAEDPTWDYYSFSTPDNDAYAVLVTVDYSQGAVELYARYGNVPSMEGSDYAAPMPLLGQARHQMTIYACASPGGDGDSYWYIGVASTTVPATYTIRAQVVTHTPTQLSVGTTVTDSISNYAWKYYYVDMPANTAFLSATLVPPANTAGGTAIYLRAMACPTMRELTKMSDAANVQTAAVSCTETMEARWFIGVVSVSGTSTPYQLSLYTGPYENINNTQLVTASVPSNGWRNYRMTVPVATALALTMTTPASYQSLKIYLNQDSCSTQDQQQIVGGFAGSSLVTTTHTTSQLVPIAAGTWYFGVTGDCRPATTCAYTMRAVQNTIRCAVPTVTDGASFCTGVTWNVGNYTNIVTADASAQVSYNGAVAATSNSIQGECAFVVRMMQCASFMPACDATGLPQLPCRLLCQRYNRCTGANLQCSNTLLFAPGTACTAPPGYSAASTVIVNYVLLATLVAAALFLML